MTGIHGISFEVAQQICKLDPVRVAKECTTNKIFNYGAGNKNISIPNFLESRVTNTVTELCKVFDGDLNPGGLKPEDEIHIV